MAALRNQCSSREGAGIAIRIVLAHNFYQQPGGEDQVFWAEGKLLEEAGHEVQRYTVHNDAVEGMGRLELARKTLWNPTTHDALRALLRRHRPDIVHVHNSFPLLSPSVYDAAKAEGAAVVQTLHNFRLLCPAATFFRDGGPCEACLPRRVAWPAVAHACYRGSRAASGTVAAMLAYHKLRRSYHRQVDAYIALTEFSRRKFLEGGFPAEKLHVKGNFLAPDPGVGNGAGDYALFVGRLSEEKGVRVLLAAWETLRDIPLVVVGDGPLRDEVERASAALSSVRYLGQQPREEVLRLMGEARMLVFPSTWYETFGNVVIEAFAVGTPVVASDLGTMPSLVTHGRTGLLFAPGDAAALAEQVAWAQAHPDEWAAFRRAAREEYLARHTAPRNYQRLMEIYAAALETRHHT